MSDDEDFDAMLLEEKQIQLEVAQQEQLMAEENMEEDDAMQEPFADVTPTDVAAAGLGPERLTRNNGEHTANMYAEDDDRSSVGNNYDQDERDDFSARMGGGRPRPRAAHNPTPSVRGGGSAPPRSTTGAQSVGAESAATQERLLRGIKDVPGFSSQMMGGVGADQISPLPPIFNTGLPGYWVQMTNEGPFRGEDIRPVRVIDMGFIGAWQQASDAERISDFTPQTDPIARARSVAVCALMGILSVGMAKGLIASPNHSEFSDLKRKDPDEFNKEKKKLNGKISTYTFCPNEKSSNHMKRIETAMMFSFVHVSMHSPEGKYVGFKILMLIFDRGFSTDMLVNEIMKENAALKASGEINGMPESMRNSKMERQNKLQRAQITDEDLDRNAGQQYKRIKCNADILKMMEAQGGSTPARPGRPYYNNIGEDTPPGCVVHPFERDPGDELGGQHPFGPSVSHNHKRYTPPTADSPGINVSIAGVLDARGLPIELHESLMDPLQWYDKQGNFKPPQHVIDNGWCHICHDPSVTNIFNAPLPNKMHGNVEPEDCLLEIFWSMNKDTHPILKKAQARGLTTLAQNRDSVLSLFHNMEDAVDPDQHRLSRAVLDTEMLSGDSIDKSVAEEATIERRAYGKTTTEKNGNVWVLSVRQVLRDTSEYQVSGHTMVDDWDQLQRTQIRNKDYDATELNREPYKVQEATRWRRAKHAEATFAMIKLGLQRFEHAFGRAKARKSIPPGYYDVAHVGLKAAVKEAGEIAHRRSACGLGRIVNPDDPNVLLGTANVGFAHKQSLVATDLTPFGHHRAFLMRLFSSGVNIAGRDVKIMLEMHMHAFEPFQEVSFFLLLCGGPGSGKSMRAKRLMALLCEGWVKPSGSSSAKAGMNGGMDFLCGRLVYYDEITNDFASNDSERIEYARIRTRDIHATSHTLRISVSQMEQRVLNTRSVKTMGEGGLETFTTVVLDSLHYESHLMCTNCGPLGLKGDTEPSTNRAALSDRSWAHIVHSTDDHESGDVDFDMQKASEPLKQQVNRYRVCTCLVAYVLIFIKHIPSCRPNLTYANMLCNKWYDIMWNEYNLPRPSKRKKLKLRMMLELFAVESAVFEKFMLPESAVDFADMLPDENGQLTPFCIDQLADVVRSLQRCLDLEVIHTAWSHSLDHSPATSAHVFQVKTVLAQLHGSELDRSTLNGEPQSNTQSTNTPPMPAPQPQGRTDEVDTSGVFNDISDHPEMDELNGMRNEHNRFATSSATGVGASSSAPLGMSIEQMGAPPGQRPPTIPRDSLPKDWEHRHEGPIQPPNNVHNDPTHFVHPTIKKIMTDGMTRQRAADTAEELATTRELRCELSNRALTTKISRDGGGEHQQLTRIFTDWSDSAKEPQHRMTSTGAVISAKSAAGACMPNTSDLINSGMDSEFIKQIANGKTSVTYTMNEAKIGTRNQRLWEYETLPGEVVLKGPRDYDFNWACLSALKKGAPGDSSGAGSGPKQKSLWTNSARVVRSHANRVFSLVAIVSMSLESIRDSMYSMFVSTIENKIRIPKSDHNRFQPVNSMNSKSGRVFDIADSCMLSNGQGFSDTTDVVAIHPKHMFVDRSLGSTMTPEFESPKNLERPHNSTVGNTLGQKRLDHLSDNRAFPVCITPENFERGVPIKECEAFNGIYFNKHTASEQAALVIEMGLFLANVPGIAGGKYTMVPDTFKTTLTERSAAQLEAIHEAARLEAARENEDSDANMVDATVPTRQDDYGDEILGEAQTFEVEDKEDEEDSDAAYLEQDASPLVDCDSHTDHDSVQRGVTHPDSDDLHVNPGSGATDRAAKASIDPGSMVPTLPYEWDQLAIFFSIKMVGTLHNDVHAYVDKFCAGFPDVYENEEREDTLATLPQISIRFPGITDTKSGKSENIDDDGKTKDLMPLSCSIPLTQSRFCDVGRQIKSTRSSKGLTEAVHSFANGRAIAHNDPEVQEQEAEARGIDSGIILDGNLFARSTWQRFTLSALDSRGMRTPEEEARVNDQGLCVRLRIRNHRGAEAHHEMNPSLDGCTEAKAHTFTAQERLKRKLGDGEDDEDSPMESLNCKRRYLEHEREKEAISESMDAEPTV